MDDIAKLAAQAHHGICGAITGRAIYEGTLDLDQAQIYSDKYSRYEDA
jgi:phosphoribosylformimino-5-aminoimidazole carboxamide ribotide isomerase